MQSLQEYKKVAAPARVSQFESGKYARGSLAQRLFEPLAGCKRDENGTLIVEISDKDLQHGLDEAKVRAQFERSLNQDVLIAEEDSDELRVAIMEEIQSSDMPIEEWNDYIDKELSVFKAGEKYDYVKDLRSAFAEGLSSTTADKILETIPEHVFWDIKKPMVSEDNYYMNPYNPARKYPGESFFDIRKTEAWMLDRATNNKLTANVSTFKMY